MASCAVKDDPNTSWPPLCPNTGAAYFFLILFFLTTCAHLVQSIIHRKVYSWVIIMSGIWQTLAYAFRIVSIKNYKSSGMYTAWFVLILLAPLWTNAYVYMVLGRMIYNFTASARIYRIPAWRFGLYFVLLDVVAFIVQASGASMASGDDLTNDQIMRGLHIYMAGIGVQLFFILVFFAIAFRTRQMMLRDNPAADKAKPLLLLNVLFAILILIIVRIVFRLIEYSDGYNSGIPVHEAYQYCLDSLPMFIALVMLNIVHPGRIMPGPESNLPSRKSRKALGKANVRGRATAAQSLPLYGYNGSTADNEPNRAQKPHNAAYTNIDAVEVNV